MSKAITIASKSTRSEKDIINSIYSIFESTTTMSIASNHHKTNTAYINTAFFAYDEDGNIFFASPRDAVHSVNIGEDSVVSVAISLPPPEYGEQLQGVQLFGTCMPVNKSQLKHAFTTYATRFGSFKSAVKSISDFVKNTALPNLYIVKPTSFKLLDEIAFSRREYIEGNIEIND